MTSFIACPNHLKNWPGHVLVSSSEVRWSPQHLWGRLLLTKEIYILKCRGWVALRRVIVNGVFSVRWCVLIGSRLVDLLLQNQLLLLLLKKDSKAQLMCSGERFKPQISVGQHFDAPSFTSKQCFHTNFTTGCLENFTWSTRGREERERACGAGPIEKTLKFWKSEIVKNQRLHYDG